MLVDWLSSQEPVLQALVGTCFTWLLTALGASVVFVFSGVKRKLLDGMLGFAAGIMIAASYFSLLAPAIEMAAEFHLASWIPAAAGFTLGAIVLWGIDKVLPHLHLGFPIEEAEGIKTHWQRSILLVLAITLHNIPEGLAVGVAFGAAAQGESSITLAGAIALTIGIGLQNIPEGTAVSVPLHREGMGRSKAFWYGQLSGLVEPVSGVLGVLAVLKVRPLLPYALAFAAGAMIYVVVEEIIPESQLKNYTHEATFGVILGFVIMMILDVAFG